MDKPRFNLEEHMGINECMHCNTEEKAKIFGSFLNDNGRKWISGLSYTKDAMLWGRNTENTVYLFNDGTYGSLFEVVGKDILEFDDFDWSKEKPDTVTISREEFKDKISMASAKSLLCNLELKEDPMKILLLSMLCLDMEISIFGEEK